MACSWMNHYFFMASDFPIWADGGTRSLKSIQRMTCITSGINKHQPQKWLSHGHLVSVHHWFSLQWRHNEHQDVPNHRRLECLSMRLFRLTSKKTSKPAVLALCEGNTRDNNAESVSMRWCHHVTGHNTIVQQEPWYNVTQYLVTFYHDICMISTGAVRVFFFKFKFFIDIYIHQMKNNTECYLYVPICIVFHLMYVYANKELELEKKNTMVAYSQLQKWSPGYQ